MMRLGLTLLLGMGLLGSAQAAWSESTAAGAPTVVAPVAASATSPAAATSAAPTAVSAPMAQASAPAASTAAAPATTTPLAAGSAATTGPAPAATATAAAAPEPASTAPAPAETAAPAQAPAMTGSIQVPVRGMDMTNVEHIFGTPLQKQDAVGKPPITRWVYTDYVVYFEYNKVLHTVMKSAPFSNPG